MTVELKFYNLEAWFVKALLTAIFHVIVFNSTIDFHQGRAMFVLAKGL